MSWNVWEKLRNIRWTRDKSGSNLYVVDGNNAWTDYGKLTNLQIAQTHPILTPAMLFVSKLFSQAEFTVKDKTTLKVKPNHWLTKLLNKPNPYQTQNDFLESLQFMQIAQGKAVVYLKRPIGFERGKDIEAMYILDSDKIKWPENYKSKIISNTNTQAGNQKIVYDPDGENLDIEVKNLLFFYDLPNCMRPNYYETTSRLDGFRQTLINTHDSLIAKNIILKTNGKEMLSTGGNEHFPLTGDDKEQAENLLQNNYGLGWNRKRGIVTTASVTYQSMHIALRDLGLDESVKVDGNIIFTGLHIPKDIISLEAKKTTYNNFKESMVSYVQNEMQATLNSFIEVMSTVLDDDSVKLCGSYEHLPIMQFILIERYEGISKKAKALNDLLLTGIPQEIALEMTGFDRSIELNPIQVVTTSTAINSNIEPDEDEEDDEEDKSKLKKVM